MITVRFLILALMDWDWTTGKRRAVHFSFSGRHATVARLLVRQLIPGSISGNTMEDVLRLKADYGKLDADGNPVRIRLNSTAVNVKQGDSANAKQGVSVAYMRDGKLKARESHALCAGLLQRDGAVFVSGTPETQKKALEYSVKARFCIPMWRFGIGRRSPSWNSPDSGAGAYHLYTALDLPVSIGHVQILQQAGRAGGAVHAANALSPGAPAAGSISSGALRIVEHEVRNDERNISRTGAADAGAKRDSMPHAISKRSP